MTGDAARCSRADATLAAVLADPSARLDAHVTECPTCGAVARNALAFERSLGTAAAALVVEPLPPAYRVVGPSGARSSASGRGLRGAGQGIGALASLTAILAIVALVATNGGPFGRGGTGGTPGSGRSAAASELPSGEPRSAAPASGLTVGPGASAAPGAACRTAFSSWMTAWEGGSRAEYRGGSPIPAAERQAAFETFQSCTLEALRSMNAATNVARIRAKGKVQTPFIEVFDKTVGVWCLTDDSLAASPVCRSAAAGVQKTSFYVIRSGDTLSGIAARFGVSLDALLAENPQVDNPDWIAAGDVLLLPAGTTAAATANGPPSASP